MRRVPPSRPLRAGHFLALAALVIACAPERPGPALAGDAERTSYAIGLHLGGRLRDLGTEVDPERIVDGFFAGIAPPGTQEVGLDPRLLEIELERLALAARTQEGDRTRAARASANERAGVAFLRANRERAGVVELPSGIQYAVLAAGSEPPPALADRVTVTYEGRLLDGSVFDSSQDRFAPTIVRLARTPRGWREVLPLVPGGATVEIWIPAHADPAEHPAGLVPPGELVAFTVRVDAIDRHQNPDVTRGRP